MSVLENIIEQAKMNGRFAPLHSPELLKVLDEKSKQLQNIGLPQRKSETWKYTSLRRLENEDVELHNEIKFIDYDYITQNKISPDCIVFVNGVYSAPLSSLPNHKDVSFTEWRSKCEDLSEIYLGKVPEFLLKISKAEDLIGNLSQIFIENSLLITVRANTKPEHPLQLMHINFPQHPQKVDAAMANIFIRVEAGAQSQIIETHVSADSDKMTFSNTMYRIDLATGAELTHFTLQCEGQRAQHFSGCSVNVAEAAKYESLLYQAGSQLGRHELKVKLKGTKAKAKLLGLYYGRAEQQLDQITTVEHLVPDTESSQYYKGMMADASRAVFNGKITVAPHAKNTVARQLSRNLLLDKKAEVNAKPELQISNNDVSCSHGASIGELDQDLLFYLQSRCIKPNEARAMLARAFANEIIEKIELPKVKHYINQHLDQSMQTSTSQEAPHVD